MMDTEAFKKGYTDIHEDVIRSIVVTGPKYYATLATAAGLTLVCFFFPWFYQLYYGIGAAGMNHPGVWEPISPALFSGSASAIPAPCCPASYTLPTAPGVRPCTVALRR